MIVDKVDEMISFRQNQWLETWRNFNSQKRNLTKEMFSEKVP